MRRYLAIIADSFREAIASWILWIMLGAISLAHLVLLPLGYREQKPTVLKRNDIGMAASLALYQELKASEGTESSPAADLVWQTIKPSQRGQLDDLADDTDRRFVLRELLRNELNKFIREQSELESSHWEGLTINAELKELRDRPANRLTQLERQRRNRLWLDAAFGEQIQSSANEEMVISYFLATTPPFAATREQAEAMIETIILPLVMKAMIGVAAIFVAILVTAGIIPRMFDSGSINLLLSKPLSRSLLFLAKYIGGCAFVAVCVTYLLVGFWLIIGTRFGFWNNGLLWCIPVFIFIFAIYYVVSAFAALLWRNAIVSVIMTVAFFCVCFGLGAANDLMMWLLSGSRINHLMPIGDDTLAMLDNGEVKQWDADNKSWVSAGRLFNDVPLLAGVINSPENDEIVALHRRAVPFGPSAMRLVRMRAKEGWAPTMGQRLSGRSGQLLPEEGGQILLNSRGLHRVTDEAFAQGGQGFFGWDLGGMTEIKMDPPGSFLSPLTGAANPSTRRLAVYSRGSLATFEHLADGSYRRLKTAKLNLSEDRETSALVSFAGDEIALVTSAGQFALFDVETLELTYQQQLEKFAAPRHLLVIQPSGRKFIEFHNGRLWATGDDGKTASLAAIPNQGHILAVADAGEDQLAVADRLHRVAIYDASSLRRVRKLEADMTRFETIYQYGIIPLYTILPRPAELDSTIQYALTGQEAAALPGQDLAARRQRVNPWAPVGRCSLFVAVVLGLACFYIERQEF